MSPPLGALHAVHLDRTRALLLAEGEVVGVGAALVEGRLAAARALPAAPLVPDLLAQVHLGHIDVLALEVVVEGALRAGEVVPGGEDVVDRLAPGEARLDLPG